MIYQRALRKQAIHKRYVVGVHPIIQFFINKLKIEEIIGTYIKQDRRLKLSIETVLVVLIHNILSTPKPLYEIADWLAPLDEKNLGLGLQDRTLIHDDRVGKALETFYWGRHKDVFFHLALKAIKVFDLDCSQVHQDTTTVTFSGRYAGWGAQELLTYGHNKDHRPDLKQLVLGLSVTADGAVPLVHQVYDGNQTDDRLHGSNHQRLRRLLKKSDFIYVADCKLATDSNLGKIVACGGRFISVMPRSWKEDAWFREEVKQGKIKWQRILSRKNNRKPDSKVDHYELADGSYQTSQGYLLHWIRSSQKAEQDSQTRQRHIDDALVGLSEVQSGLNQYRLKSYKNIEKKITQVLKENGSEAWIVYEINEHKGYKVSHQGVGRPRKGDNGEKLETKYFSISFAVNQEAVKWEAMTDGVFPLITNAEQMSAKRVLEVYKFQPFLEKRHSQLKSQQEISPVYLKKGERVVAFLHVHIMALMVATLIERTLRKAMQKKDIEVLPLYPEGRACRHPTIFDLVRLFRGVERYEVEDRQGVTIFPAELTDTQKQVLKLLEVPLSFYH